MKRNEGFYFCSSSLLAQTIVFYLFVWQESNSILLYSTTMREHALQHEKVENDDNGMIVVMMIIIIVCIYVPVSSVAKLPLVGTLMYILCNNLWQSCCWCACGSLLLLQTLHTCSSKLALIARKLFNCIIPQHRWRKVYSCILLFSNYAPFVLRFTFFSWHSNWKVFQLTVKSSFIGANILYTENSRKL